MKTERACPRCRMPIPCACGWTGASEIETVTTVNAAGVRTVTRPISHRHWRVQTRTPEGGWVTRNWVRTALDGILAAEGYADLAHVAARVMLGDREYYRTESEPKGELKP